MQPPTCSADTFFVEPLLTIFEDRLYKQAKSNFIQYIILFIVGHVNIKDRIDSNARIACKSYMQRILSYLILKAFPESGGQDTEHLTSRMQAINYLGSLMAQQVAPLPAATFIRCLSLTLEKYADHKSGPNELSYSRIFQHCFIMNLALVFASRPLEIRQHNPRFFDKISTLLFHKKWASLEFASPSTLHLLYESIHN